MLNILVIHTQVFQKFLESLLDVGGEIYELLECVDNDLTVLRVGLFQQISAHHLDLLHLAQSQLHTPPQLTEFLSFSFILQPGGKLDLSQLSVNLSGPGQLSLLEP